MFSKKECWNFSSFVERKENLETFQYLTKKKKKKRDPMKRKGENDRRMH